MSGYKYKGKAIIKFFFFVFLLLFFFGRISAEPRQSPNYMIQYDSLNAGGDDSSSGSFLLNDTLGEQGTGESASANYKMLAGFWYLGGSYLAVSAPDDLSLASISGLSGGGSEGTVSWNITTDNMAGFVSQISSSTVPALTSDLDDFPDYSPDGPQPDFDFWNDASDSAFGISAEGEDISDPWKDDGDVCATGENDTPSKCWGGLSTTLQTVSERTTSNHPDGTETTVRFRAETGDEHIQTAGDYQAIVTLTVLPL